MKLYHCHVCGGIGRVRRINGCCHCQYCNRLGRGTVIEAEKPEAPSWASGQPVAQQFTHTHHSKKGAE